MSQMMFEVSPIGEADIGYESDYGLNETPIRNLGCYAGKLQSTSYLTNIDTASYMAPAPEIDTFDLSGYKDVAEEAIDFISQFKSNLGESVQFLTDKIDDNAQTVQKLSNQKTQLAAALKEISKEIAPLEVSGSEASADQIRLQTIIHKLQFVEYGKRIEIMEV